MQRKLSLMFLCLLLFCLVLLAACGAEKPDDAAVLSVGDAYPDKGDFSAPALSADGKTAYFSGGTPPSPPTLLEAHFADGKWNRAEKSPLGAGTSESSLYVSQDGTKILFSSHRAVPNTQTGNSDLWISEKTPKGWSQPVNIGAPVNSPAREYSPAIAANGNLYFVSNRTDDGTEGEVYCVYFSIYDQGRYAEPIKLNDALGIAENAFVQYVSADESFLLLACERAGGKGKSDLYVSWRTGGKWQRATALNDSVNTPASEASARITPDMKYLIFTRNDGSKTAVEVMGLKEAGIEKP